MLPPQLDERLLTAAALFPACDTGADVGADHGRLSCYLLEKGVCRHMIVTDVSEYSLAKARDLMARHRLNDRVTFAVGDGFAALPSPVRAAAVLGMGGETVAGILLRGREYLHGASLILSPQTEFMRVRATVAAMGYRLDTEKIARAQGRFYVVMRAVPGEMQYDERQLLLGPCLMQTNEENYPKYVKWRRDVTACERREEAKRHLLWLEEECARVHADG